MNFEERQIDRAMNFFKLTRFFNFEDLQLAYESSKKNIDEMNKESEKNGVSYRFVSQDIENFYLALYKELMKNHIRKLLMKNIEFKNVNGEEKIFVHNLDRKYLDFYNSNSIYSSILSMFFRNISYEFKTLEGIGIANAKSIEEVNDIVEKFGTTIEQEYQKFASIMIEEVKKDAPYKSSNIIYEVDMSKITNVVSLITETYNVIQSMFDKRSVIKEFIQKSSDFNKKLGKKDEITEEDMQKKALIDKASWSYFSRLFKERNAEEFIKIYNEGVLYISQIVDASIVKEPDGEVPPTPPTPGGRK